eukprot:2501574-Pyramimonas_sp.AAC.1
MYVPYDPGQARSHGPLLHIADLRTLLESTAREVQYPKKKRLGALPRGRLRIAEAFPGQEGSKHAKTRSSSFVAKPAE